MTNTLNEAEQKVLLFFNDNNPEHGFGFDTIAGDMKMERRDVRAACRSLRTRGLATFHSTLWHEDENRVMGSGYSATKTGLEIAAAIAKAIVAGPKAALLAEESEVKS